MQTHRSLRNIAKSSKKTNAKTAKSPNPALYMRRNWEDHIILMCLTRAESIVSQSTLQSSDNLGVGGCLIACLTVYLHIIFVQHPLSIGYNMEWRRQCRAVFHRQRHYEVLHGRWHFDVLVPHHQSKSDYRIKWDCPYREGLFFSNPWIKSMCILICVWLSSACIMTRQLQKCFGCDAMWWIKYAPRNATSRRSSMLQSPNAWTPPSLISYTIPPSPGMRPKEKSPLGGVNSWSQMGRMKM